MSCGNRLGKLEIPNGLAGPPGTPGVNGAGWQSGSGVPRGTPPADILFYLNVDSGQLFKWNGTTWVSIVNSIYGTDGGQWITGTGIPTSTSYPAGTLYLDVGVSSPTKGNIYQYSGVSWGASIGNIQGEDGDDGIDGTDSGTTLLTSYNIPFATYTSAPISVGGQTHNLIPVQGFNPSVLCPTDGSAGRIKINLQCARSSAGFTDKISDFFALTFYIQQSPSPIIELKPSQDQTVFNNLYQQQFMTGIPCATSQIGGTTYSSITTVSIEITINRISQLSFLYTVDYIWSNGVSSSNVFGGYVSSGFSFGLTTATYNFNLINYSDTGKNLTVRGYLTMEKITP